MKDGTKAYAWLFANEDFKVFLFRDTRGSCVPKEALGDENPNLALVTDRYGGYSPLNVRRQYCFVHLLRDVKEEERHFPGDTEVISFAPDIKPLLSGVVSSPRNLSLPKKINVWRRCSISSRWTSMQTYLQCSISRSIA